MNRTILTFEATISSNGFSADGLDAYTVRLYVNHHIVGHWDLDATEGYLMTQDRAHLDQFVAEKMYRMLHPVTAR